MRFCCEESHKYTDVRPEHRVKPAMAQVVHHKEGASSYTRSFIAYTVLTQIDDEQCYAQTHLHLENEHHWLRGPLF